jgi:hypothetical protein
MFQCPVIRLIGHWRHWLRGERNGVDESLDGTIGLALVAHRTGAPAGRTLRETSFLNLFGRGLVVLRLKQIRRSTKRPTGG